MSIKIVVSNQVSFKVKGTIKSESGVDVPFDFTLKCDRLTTEQITEKIKNTGEMTVYADFMADVITDWGGVLDDDGSAIPYSEAKFRELSLIPGVAAISYHTYVAEVGAKAKNS